MAQAIETIPEDIANVAREGRLDEIPGVGKSIAEKIQEIIETGDLAYLESLREELPEGVPDLTRIEGIGPKRALILSRDLGIRSIDDLEAAAKAGRVRDLPDSGRRPSRTYLPVSR